MQKIKDTVRRIAADAARGRRFGYVAAASAVLILALFAFANYRGRLAGTSGVPVPESAAASSAAERQAAQPGSERHGAGVTASGDASAVPAGANVEATSTRSDPTRGATDASGTGAGSANGASAGRSEPLPPLPNRAIVSRGDRVAKPAAVKGLYLNAWAAGSARKLDRLMRIAEATEVNAFVIDVKEAGRISYRSRVPLAARIGADARYITDIEGVLAKLKSAGIYPIARIVVFKDPVLAAARPQYAIQHRDGGQWLDNAGDAWVDSYNREVWDYNIEIAREAIELGFAEVQWDYVRFPDVPSSYMRTAVWPASAGRAKEDAIREFLRYSRERLADLGAPVTADVFGLTVSADGDMGIGQQWDKMLDVTDVLLPMIYPSHFARGSYGIAYPNSEPYRTVKTALEHARRRTDGVPNAAGIRPWLQDFTLGQPAYGAAHVRAQIQAAEDAGVREWVLWNPGSNYTVEALANANGVPPDLPIPDRVWRPQTRPADTTAVRDTSAAGSVRADTSTTGRARAYTSATGSVRAYTSATGPNSRAPF